MHGGPFHVMRRIAFLLLLSLPAGAADKPADVVKYRQSVMKAMGAHLTALSLVAKKQVSGRSQLASHAEAVRAMSAGLAAFFPKGTGPDTVKSEAKPAIWERWSEFEAAAKTLERDSALLAAAANEKDGTLLAARLDATGKACAGCHKQFRQEHD
ncbi:MAG: cytochrome [Acidobacteria bacterium]|nr:cytochrome [Acidobacteriota bacterium]